MARRKSDEALDDVLASEDAEVSAVADESVEADIEEVITQPEEIAESEANDVVESVPEAETEEVVEAETEEAASEIQEEITMPEAPTAECKQGPIVFKPTSLIPVYKLPNKKYYDFRTKVSMVIADPTVRNGFVSVNVALSGHGVRKLFVKKEHLPADIQNKLS